jgi:[ribosomal protein S5]-alanine N-acetyltransferase
VAGTRKAAARVVLRSPGPEHADAFIALALASRRFHAGLVSPPRDHAKYGAFLERNRHDDFEAFLLFRREDDALLGAANLSQIFRLGFQSAYLGYWIGAPYARRGYMAEGLALVLSEAFRGMKLHRIEANIQPENIPSRRVVQKLGFRREGYSPRYLKIAGRWRDHERWAILREEWKPGGTASPPAGT